MKLPISLISFIFFSLLALVLIFPILSPGYILTMDAVFTPRMPWPALTSSSFLYESFLSVASTLAASFWLEKGMLFLIFFLSGWGMSRLISPAFGWVRFYAGLFYTINPFVYERVSSGQLALLLGYALFPFLIRITIDFFTHPTRGRALILSILATITMTISIHYSLIFASFFLIYGVIIFLLRSENQAALLRTIPIVLGLLLLFNINWILPMIVGSSDMRRSIEEFSSNDLLAFQSVSDPQYGLIFNLLSGYGFWAEGNDYFQTPKTLMPIWPILTVLVAGLSLYGFYVSLKKRENLVFAITLGVAFLVSLDLAAGIALQNFPDVFTFLYEKIFFIRGFREPQKLIAVLMFGYAYFGAIGLSELNRKITGYKKIILGAMVFSSPILYAFVLVFGLWGQVKPVFYPTSWERVDTVLREDRSDFTTLFFPWHQYMKFRFANNAVLANPAPFYFSKPVLSSRSVETKYLYSHDTRLDGLHVEGLLSIEKENVNLLGDPVHEDIVWGEALALVNVKYIILSKNDDWQFYWFLDRSNDLEKVYEDDDLILYKNNLWSIPSNKESESVETYTEEDMKNLDEN